MILEQLRFRGFRRKQLLLFCWRIYKDNYSVFHKEKTIFCSFTNFWIYHITWNPCCIKFNGLMPFSCIHGTGLVFIFNTEKVHNRRLMTYDPISPRTPQKSTKLLQRIAEKRWSKTRTKPHLTHFCATLTWWTAVLNLSYYWLLWEQQCLKLLVVNKSIKWLGFKRMFCKTGNFSGTKKKKKLFYGRFWGQENHFQWPKVDSVVIIPLGGNLSK